MVAKNAKFSRNDFSFSLETLISIYSQKVRKQQLASCNQFETKNFRKNNTPEIRTFGWMSGGRQAAMSHNIFYFHAAYQLFYFWQS